MSRPVAAGLCTERSAFLLRFGLWKKISWSGSFFIGRDGQRKEDRRGKHDYKSQFGILDQLRAEKMTGTSTSRRDGLVED